MMFQAVSLYFKRIKFTKPAQPVLFDVPFRDIYFTSHGDGETSQYINGVATFEAVNDKKEDAPLRFVEADKVWASSPLGAYEIDVEDDTQRRMVRQAIEQDDAIWKTAKKLAKAKKLI